MYVDKRQSFVNYRMHSWFAFTDTRKTERKPENDH